MKLRIKNTHFLFSFEIMFYGKGHVFDIDILPQFNLYKCDTDYAIRFGWLIFKFDIFIDTEMFK